MSNQRRPIIGVRGIPSGPKVDLSKIKVGTHRHQLYVKVVSNDDKDYKSHNITIEILKFIHDRLPLFKQMGINIKINKIRSRDLQDPRLISAMKKNNITRLPAIKTANNIYIGRGKIIDLYDRNIKEFEAINARGIRPIEGITEEDDLERFYKTEMSFDRAEKDTEEEEEIGENTNMLDAYRSMMDRRNNSARPDNVETKNSNIVNKKSSHEEEDEIRKTIDRLARDIDDEMVITGENSEDYEDDNSSKYDDYMLSKYYSNMQSTDDL